MSGVMKEASTCGQAADRRMICSYDVAAVSREIVPAAAGKLVQRPALGAVRVRI